MLVADVAAEQKGPGMPLTMKERQAVIAQTRARYATATKNEKGSILDELVLLTGYSRPYARQALRRAAKPAPGRLRRNRPKVYGPEVLRPLRKIWAALDGICGKRLAAAIPETVAAMERFGELALDTDVRDKLLAVSAATVDRLLAPDRAKMTLKGRSGTKPGSILKAQIPIRTFSDWDDLAIGFFEIDLVSHDGGDPRGDFCQTLDMTCVASGWTETRAVKNKAQVWVFEALKDIVSVLPFPVLGIDSDNGVEFINQHLLRWCTEHKVTFTRSRAHKKNDNCFVEQKNYSVVRRAVGYTRYDTGEELVLLNKLYELLRLHTNFFLPTMRLATKERNGASRPHQIQDRSRKGGDQGSSARVHF